MGKKILGGLVAGCMIVCAASPAANARLMDWLGSNNPSLPNDTMFDDQWALNNTGQRVRGISGIEDIDMDIPEAWQYILDNFNENQRKEAIVAVLDSGVNSSHVDLEGKITSGYNFVDNNSDTEDENGHGTIIAGIIAAERDNRRGIAGIADKVKIMPVKVLDDTGTGNIENLRKGILYAADHGADIINLSLVGSYSETLNDAIEYAYSKGAIIVSASGSDGMNISSSSLKSPINNEDGSQNLIIGVSALTNGGERYSKSNYGKGIDISAPGGSVISSYNRSNWSYVYASGTSLAAANVSGVAALLKTCFPDKTNAEISEAIINYSSSFSQTMEGMGSGVVNAYGAVKGMNEDLDPEDPENPEEPEAARLVRFAEDLTVFFVENGVKRGISRPEILEAYGWSFEDVEVLNSKDEIEKFTAGKLLGFPKGYVVKGSDMTVFEIQDNEVARPFSNPDAFLAHGHKWEDIKEVTDYEIQNSYTIGEPIVQ